MSWRSTATNGTGNYPGGRKLEFRLRFGYFGIVENLEPTITV